jgi:hypothetical protein
MIKSLARTALWYVFNDRRVLYTGFGYIGRDGLPHHSIGLPQGATLEEIDRAVCAGLTPTTQCMVPVLQEVTENIREVNPELLQSKSHKIME